MTTSIIIGKHQLENLIQDPLLRKQITNTGTPACEYEKRIHASQYCRDALRTIYDVREQLGYIARATEHNELTHDIVSLCDQLNGIIRTIKDDNDQAILSMEGLLDPSTPNMPAQTSKAD